ncbi:calpain-like cysteine peptidase [Leishmania tarentolae]|uniref:Calpain-like cysteine peptidase n=1 Tax=Leishmania tarentolae TaxID=5689 RepID=A0A640KIZ6_LEITA|nr:calpain-like cysteine peptidase [Leishmania tarentolae]
MSATSASLSRSALSCSAVSGVSMLCSTARSLAFIATARSRARFRSSSPRRAASFASAPVPVRMRRSRSTSISWKAASVSSGSSDVSTPSYNSARTLPRSPSFSCSAISTARAFSSVSLSAMLFGSPEPLSFSSARCASFAQNSASSSIGSSSRGIPAGSGARYARSPASRLRANSPARASSCASRAATLDPFPGVHTARARSCSKRRNSASSSSGSARRGTPCTAFGRYISRSAAFMLSAMADARSFIVSKSHCSVPTSGLPVSSIFMYAASASRYSASSLSGSVSVGRPPYSAAKHLERCSATRRSASDFTRFCISSSSALIASAFFSGFFLSSRSRRSMSATSASLSRSALSCSAVSGVSMLCSTARSLAFIATARSRARFRSSSPRRAASFASAPVPVRMRRSRSTSISWKAASVSSGSSDVSTPSYNSARTLPRSPSFSCSAISTARAFSSVSLSAMLFGSPEPLSFSSARCASFAQNSASSSIGSSSRGIPAGSGARYARSPASRLRANSPARASSCASRAATLDPFPGVHTARARSCSKRRNSASSSSGSARRGTPCTAFGRYVSRSAAFMLSAMADARSFILSKSFRSATGSALPESSIFMYAASASRYSASSLSGSVPVGRPP